MTAIFTTQIELDGDGVAWIGGTKVKVAVAAKLVGEYDASRPDENIEYYQAKLTDLFEKFSVFAGKPGLFDAAELQVAAEPADTSQQDFFPTPEK